MISLKANISRLLFIPLCGAIIFSLLNLTSAMGQDDPYDMPEDPPYMSEDPPLASDDWEMTTYNTSTLFDVVANDFGMSHPIDSSTLTIVRGAQSGTAEVDPQTGMILYTPNQNFSGFDVFQYTVADTAGNVSNVAFVEIWVENFPPMITFFIYESSEHLWVFEGTVWDENPSTCVVEFGGLLAGESATVDQNGHFEFQFLLENGEEGAVSAEATDELGELSGAIVEHVYQF